MSKLTKTRRSKNFQKIVAKAMYQKSNTNVEGDTSFAEMQTKRDETLNHLYEAVLKASDHKQAQQIVDIVTLGIRGNEFVDAMPIMAVGDVMAYMRNEVRKSIKQVRSYKTVESVIELDKARTYQNYENMVAVYLTVNKAYYTLYTRGCGGGYKRGFVRGSCGSVRGLSRHCH
jgi:SAM-dependent MidA family methyltransferase